MGHPQQNAPGEDGGEAGFQGGADDVRVIGQAEDTDDGRVKKIVEGRVDEGEVAVRHLAQARNGSCCRGGS